MVLGYKFWQRRYAGRTDMYTIVGVTPPGFT
jgi:hypothetical protein